MNQPLPLVPFIIMLANFVVALFIYVLADIERNRRWGYRPRRFWRLYLLATITALPACVLLSTLLRFGAAFPLTLPFGR